MLPLPARSVGAAEETRLPPTSRQEARHSQNKLWGMFCQPHREVRGLGQAGLPQGYWGPPHGVIGPPPIIGDPPGLLGTPPINGGPPVFIKSPPSLGIPWIWGPPQGYWALHPICCGCCRPSSLTLLADRRCEQLWRCCRSTPDTLHIMEKFILPSLERLTSTFSEAEELTMFISVD